MPRARASKRRVPGWSARRRTAVDTSSGAAAGWLISDGNLPPDRMGSRATPTASGSSPPTAASHRPVSDDSSESFPDFVLPPIGVTPSVGPQIALLTANPLEQAALLHLLRYQGGPLQEADGWILSSLPGKDRVRHSVILPTPSKGQSAAASRVTEAVARYPSVSHFLFVGVAGGGGSDVRFADVVVSEHVVDIDPTAYQQGAEEHAGLVAEPSRRLLDLAKPMTGQDAATRGAWVQYLRGFLQSAQTSESYDWPKEWLAGVDSGGSRVRVGSIASSHAFVNSTEVKARWAGPPSYVIAFDMEAAGFATAAHDKERQYIVVRGICDLADGSEEFADREGRQSFAAHVSAAFLGHLLEGLPVGGQPTPASLVSPSVARDRPVVDGADSRLTFHTSLLGRDDMIAATVRRLGDDLKASEVERTVRVYNVWGPAGIGKTEFCKELIRQSLAQKVVDVCYFVRLDGASSASRITEVLSDQLALPVRDSPSVLRALVDRPGLIYLDNFEDVLDDPKAGPTLLELGSVARCAVLTSCKEGLSPEVRHIRLGPLGLDAAVELFRRQWSFRRGSELRNEEGLRDFLSSDLGCHPYSIVLVAAHADEMPSIPMLRAAWTSSRWRGMVTPTPSSAESGAFQKSMRFSFDRAVELSADAPLVWALIGLFKEGLSDSAWNRIFGDDPDRWNRAKSALIHGSIVDRDEETSRLRILPPLWSFIQDVPASGGNPRYVEQAAERAFPYFDKLTQEASQSTPAGRDTDAIRRLLADFPNLLYFIAFSAALGDVWPPRFVPLIQRTHHQFSNFQVRAVESLTVLCQRLEPLRARGTAHDLSLASLLLGEMQLGVGDLEGARNRGRRALELVRVSDDPTTAALAHRLLGWISRIHSEIDDARQHYDDGIAISERAHDQQTAAVLYQSRANLRLQLGELGPMRQDLQRAGELYSQEGEIWGIVNCLIPLATADFLSGHTEDAGQSWQRALAISESFGDHLGSAYCHLGLSRYYGRTGDATHSAEEAEAALRLFELDRFPRGVGEAHMRLAQVAIDSARSDRLDAAAQHAGQAVEIFRAMQHYDALAWANLALGRALLALDANDPAVAPLLEASKKLFEVARDREGVGRADLLECTRWLEKGDPHAAYSSAARALELFRAVGDMDGTGDSLLALAQAHVRLGDPVLARDELTQAEVAYQSTGSAAGRKAVDLLRPTLEPASSPKSSH